MKTEVIRIPVRDCETGDREHIRRVARLKPCDVIERIYYDYETGEHVLRVRRNGEEDDGWLR